MPAITSDDVKMLKWGFVPARLQGPKVAFANINARCETVATSGAYRGSFHHERCPMPADGYYERLPGTPMVPHHSRLKDGGTFAFARIWDRWDKVSVR